MQQLKQKLLKEISEAVLFSENHILQFCLDNDSDIGTATILLNKLIDDGKIQKLYYCPYEERTANEPIGNDSYPVFIIRFDKANIQELMDYNETN